MRSILTKGHSFGRRGIAARMSLARSLGIGRAPSVVEGPLAAAESTLIGTLVVLEKALVAFFFSCVCLLASMARSVNCVGQKKNCTGPFNWGEAHCAGEIVKRRAGPFQRKSLTNQTRTTTQQRGAARHGNQEPPGQAPRCTGRKNKTNHKKPETSKTNLGTP